MNFYLFFLSFFSLVSPVNKENTGPNLGPFGLQPPLFCLFLLFHIDTDLPNLDCLFKLIKVSIWDWNFSFDSRHELLCLCLSHQIPLKCGMNRWANEWPFHSLVCWCNSCIWNGVLSGKGPSSGGPSLNRKHSFAPIANKNKSMLNSTKFTLYHLFLSLNAKKKCGV